MTPGHSHGDDSVFLQSSTSVVSPTEGPFTPLHVSSPLNREGVSSPTTFPRTNNDPDSTDTMDEPSNSPQTPEERNSLRIGTVNANSIKGKRAELAELVESTKVDILIITETKLPSEDQQKKSEKTFKPAEVLPKNFEGSIHRPRSLDGGGVMVAIRNDVIAEEVPLQAGRDGEIVCAKINLCKAQPLYVCAYYRPPKDTAAALDNLELALEELQIKCESNPRSCIIVAGDFNAPGIDWENSTIKPDGRLKGMCERLLGLLDQYHLKQLVTTPTRHNPRPLLHQQTRAG